MRLLKRKRAAQQEAGVVDTSEFDLPVFLNRLFELLMKVDEWFIKRAMSLPFGSSLLVVAQKSK